MREASFCYGTFRCCSSHLCFLRMEKLSAIALSQQSTLRLLLHIIPYDLSSCRHSRHPGCLYPNGGPPPCGGLRRKQAIDCISVTSAVFILELVTHPTPQREKIVDHRQAQPALNSPYADDVGTPDSFGAIH